MVRNRLLALALAALLSAVALAAEFTPITFSPSIYDLPTDGRCVKGRSECPWKGDCKQKGDKCYSCGDGYKWSDELNACYSCGEGQTLKQVNGAWRCVS